MREGVRKRNIMIEIGRPGILFPSFQGFEICVTAFQRLPRRLARHYTATRQRNQYLEKPIGKAQAVDIMLLYYLVDPLWRFRRSKRASSSLSVFTLCIIGRCRQCCFKPYPFIPPTSPVKEPGIFCLLVRARLDASHETIVIITIQKVGRLAFVSARFSLLYRSPNFFWFLFLLFHSKVEERILKWPVSN
jgi:hypothetical protein